MRLGAPDTREAAGRVPRPRTSFVGRERELGSARRLLGCTRLLTLTGPGGSGKTRLSIALAAGVAAEFRDGVRFVPLAAVRDPSLVPASIAQGIGLQDARGQSLLEHMTSYLANRKVLLILDNFEHVLPAGEFVAKLLGASSDLRILVTSRSPLHVSGEQELPVRPCSFRNRPHRYPRRPSPSASPRSYSRPAPQPRCPASLSRARTPRPSRESCNDSTGCHWRSSWRRRG